ncbi:MAG TPA: hypothetical protein VMZ91_06910 [Candidatus Paceibacterota bacterium]|nr:hypothetical protein [Candidatus Paceibacterota bacterium]
MANFVNLMLPKKIVTDKPEDILQKYIQESNYIAESIKQGLRLQCLIKEDITFNGKIQKIDPHIRLFHKKFDYIVNGLKRLYLPRNTLLDGILILDGSCFLKDILRFYKHGLDNMNKLFDKYGMPVFIIYDVIYFDGKDLSSTYFEQRRKIIEDNIIDMEQIKKSKIYFPSFYKNKPLNGVIGQSPIFYLRKPTSFYHFYKSNAWKILKFLKSYLVVLMDAFDTPKREGECCSISIGQYSNGILIDIQKIGAISDISIRRDLFENKSDYIGKVVEIKALDRYQMYFLEPKYYRMRFDIKPEECIMEN